MSSPATNLNGGGSSSTQGYVDPKKYNKFKNDGSFLAQVLALQKKKKVRKVKEAERTDGKKKKSRKTPPHQEEDGKEKDAKENEEDEEDEEDEREVAIKNEYIEKINRMKEEGLFTDKGIGAGMVK
ncbi:conserved Plasmodium protein, unknown function [Plasmodium knowlesi strain H]|uniref:Uncharacterized protein n=3 Tax=Plasmodium knowlesi TaxID=5850 RepID=A0A5K1VE11_PLAKH|nr:conserved Plasmodium protein, unknown function [Plasmodium knowlesi strain H]OTN67010.1 Uncharacterized protein PKNOH_S07462300 [Plasmodium knowlesi]CAA9988747.1 conserved Plasmodium protein, unknown function [Plasmodium knowlesi strain H]SBO21697.1 conserved Plasmodium protein, unknown function [Plasmodium knowlesi strain H]SBO22073.1 conserved Plasmodium protein, unknown function [Plasmodium knowlesi strain H]VVS78221.1 conserved Plasmodium protein, unknown function [Plasmodium knowlesi s|eukprot:XP_002259723.1 hypothetical protein, conserved in Plasmodium species [Plasmodium knowlesi strain H]